jgi:hypothetical protein
LPAVSSGIIAPAISADGLTLYIGSDRVQNTNIDIIVLTRANKMQQFGNPTPVTELNSNGTDVPGWLSPDGCTLY